MNEEVKIHQKEKKELHKYENRFAAWQILKSSLKKSKKNHRQVIFSCVSKYVILTFSF